MEKEKKFYSQNAISITTFFGGPIAAGYLIRENYKNLDKEKAGFNALMLSIVSTLLLLSGVFLIPEDILDKIPNALFPFIISTAIYFIVEKIQGKELKLHKENGGQFYSAWRAAGIGLISIILLFVFIAIVAFFAGDFSKTASVSDAFTYEEKLTTFFENEAVSLEVFQSLQNKNTNELIVEFDKSLLLWKQNKAIVKDVNNTENLPAEVFAAMIVLNKYCDLRIKHIQLILKALHEDTDKYDQQINDIGKKIEKTIEELH